MSNESRLKVPVPRRHFLWSLNESSGEVITHIGPTEFTPSANDRAVIQTRSGAYEQPPATAAQPYVMARDGEYMVLRNPLEGAKDGSNGTFVPGANKEKELRLGSTKMIPGPCGFPLWPGQSVEVRHAHKLDANEYLLVEVVGELDERAPYARVVREAAGLSSAVIDSGEGEIEGETAEKGASTSLKIGQRIVIHGRHTHLFIPPSGIEVVPTYEESASDDDDDDSVDESAVKSLRQEAKLECRKLMTLVANGMNKREFSVLKNELRHRQDLASGERAIILTALDATHEQYRSTRRKSHVRSQRESNDMYARRAVVLGPKNFCFLFDADGNPRIVRGPARVFPGPYDTFLKRGSRRRSYDAFELSEQQALWLRLISPINREELAEHLPGVELTQARYDAGHEFIIQGKPTVFFPFIQAEVINPNTGEPHVGNNHDDVIINAIGIDQQSGIYVRDQRTGMISMVRGETSYLIDPRYEEHVHRTVPTEAWNRWIGVNESHKLVVSPVSTPWAISVTVPNKEAVLVTGPKGRRVEIGPRDILLDYEEELVTLKLSQGVSKNGHEQLKTCFLRIEGGRFADTFEVESQDVVRLRLKLGFAGRFEGEPERWFAFEDPVKLLADTVRARVREVASTKPVAELRRNATAMVREALFVEGEPLRFAENGMVLEQVDVLAVEIANGTLASLFAAVQTEAVKLELESEKAQRQLEATQRKEVIDGEENTILITMAERRAQVEIAEAESTHRTKQRQMELIIERERIKDAHEREIAAARKAAELERARLEAEAKRAKRAADAATESEARALLDARDQEHREAMARIERETAQSLAEADAIKLQAIQAELVGALQSASDSVVMKAAAENMNLVALLGGRSPMELFEQVLRGTPLERTARVMRGRSNGNGHAPEDDAHLSE